VIGGGGSAILLAGIWWVSARDWHSTASWRPALAGWFLVPIALLVLRFIEGRLGRRHPGPSVPAPGYT
jgi:hypothetical protein